MHTLRNTYRTVRYSVRLVKSRAYVADVSLDVIEVRKNIEGHGYGYE